MTRLKSTPTSVARDIDCSRNAALRAALELRLAVFSENAAPCRSVEGDPDEEDEMHTWADEMAHLELDPGRPLRALAAEHECGSRTERARPHRSPGHGEGTRLATSPRAIGLGRFCECDACSQDGEHDAECAVHDEPRGPCSCAVYRRRTRSR